MKKILAVLIVLFMVASCLFVAGTAAAKDNDKQGGHGEKKIVGGGLSDMEDFSTEGRQKEKQAKEEGVTPLGQLLQASIEDFGIIQLTANGTYSIRPMFSPDGTKIAYQNRSTSNRSIWVMNADGSNKYNVTDPYFQCAHLEGWSPDGSKLLFRSHDPNWPPSWPWPAPPAVLPPRNNLWLANTDGSGVTQITFEVNGTCFGGGDSINEVATDFSPDGSKIAFKKCYYEWTGTSWQWMYPDLWVMDANGANQVQLTNTPDNSEQYPKWSPDGSKILYKRCGDYSEADLWVINADGTNAHSVVTDVGANAFDWSPDGRWIVYGMNYDATGDEAEVFKVRADGTGVTYLTEDFDDCQKHPLWFQAGCRDVIMYRDGYDDDLWVMRSDGTNETRISPWCGEKTYDHSPNGEWIVFQTCDIGSGVVICKVRNPLYCPTEEVPALMPIGILALVGLLSVIAAISIIRKRKG